MEYKDYYKILGVSKDASKSDISKAFKKLARKYHPDLNPNDKEAETKFKEMNEAHEVLKDPEKRKMYDTLGPDWEHGQNFRPPPGYENVQFNFGGQGGGFSGSGFSDFFETIFGGHGFAEGGFTGGQRFKQRPRRGSDSEAVYSISLEEAYQGGEKSLTLQEQVTGPDSRPSLRSKTLKVKVPAGVKDGQRIRLSGQGNPGMGGGPKGDLYLRIKLQPHSVFKVQNGNILYDLPLAPWEAALGAKVKVPTLGGEVRMSIPPGIGSGKKLRLPGKGLGSGAKRGDQLVRIMIQTPADLSEKEKELWEKLADKSKFRPRKN